MMAMRVWSRTRPSVLQKTHAMIILASLCSETLKCPCYVLVLWQHECNENLYSLFFYPHVSFFTRDIKFKGGTVTVPLTSPLSTWTQSGQRWHSILTVNVWSFIVNPEEGLKCMNTNTTKKHTTSQGQKSDIGMIRTCADKVQWISNPSP
jgi:hypothetical protein